MVNPCMCYSRPMHLKKQRPMAFGFQKRMLKRPDLSLPLLELGCSSSSLSHLECCLLSELLHLLRCCLHRLLCCLLSELFYLLCCRLHRLLCCLLSELFYLLRRRLHRLTCCPLRELFYLLVCCLDRLLVHMLVNLSY